MASSYDNDLRLNEQGTGDNSGSWGTVTNLNLEIIAEAFSYGTRAIANASTDNITLADGASDADRSMYLKLTGGGQACTVTFLPATISKVWLIENATSATLTFTQGSNGANVAVLAGQVKMIATDGGGSTNGVVYDLLTDVNLAGTTVMSGATIDDVAIDGKVITLTGSAGDTATLTVAANGALAIATTDAAAAAANISITADGTFIAAATTITLDSAGAIVLDADSGVIQFKDGGTTIGSITNSSSDLVIKSNVQDKDILLQGDDGGSGITALTLDMSAGGNALFSGTVTRDLTRGSIDVGNSSGVSAPLAKGSAGTFLTSDGTDLSFAAIAAGETITFPSNWASPTATYTSSGTWSKGSLADDAYVWLYLIGGGGGGSMRENANSSGVASGGNGGGSFLIYGQAKTLNGTVYAIAAAQAGRSVSGGGTRYVAVTGNVSTFTMPSAIGGTVYTTGTGYSASTTTYVKLISAESVVDIIPLSASSDDLVLFNTPPYEFQDQGTPTGVYTYSLGGKSYNGVTPAENCVFGAGNGGGYTTSDGGTTKLHGTSQFAGAGGAFGSQGAAGAAPGGGGAGSLNGSNNGGAGAAGLLRQYNV